MSPLPDPADKPKRFKRGLRILRMAGLVLFLFLTAFYLIENWRGARAWKIAQARLAAAGESLDLKALEPPRIAPEENFCAAPALDGIGGEGDAAEIKRRRLAKLSLAPHARSGRDFIPILTWEPLDWLAWRRQLEATKHLKPPAEESDPVRAVVRAFEPHAALFDELEQAARDRPHAQFQPPLHRRKTRSDVVFLSLYSPTPFQVLTQAVEFKARALLAAGNGEQAALLLPVLVRCRQSLASGPSRMDGLFSSLAVANQISRVLHEGFAYALGRMTPLRSGTVCSLHGLWISKSCRLGGGTWPTLFDSSTICASSRRSLSQNGTATANTTITMDECVTVARSYMSFLKDGCSSIKQDT